ncbi:SIR2 family NAD-dependent protein deacylase [Roseibium sp.]|uniref:SIR2 family NAD-dependent protein deacylase n=1 Tax=Roseibium sp. TaxID=1936156 RepID=UPI003A985C19
MTEITSLSSARQFLRDLLCDPGGNLVVMTGAGISTDSGVPDFRSPGGLWSQMEPIQFDDFIRSPQSRMEDWRRRFDMKRIFDEAEPNHAHMALARLAHSGDLSLLITQNVDGLHQRSGVPDDKLVELHGNSTYATCLDCGERAELSEQETVWREGRTPTCAACGGLLKAAVISFGQSMPEDALQRAAEAARDAEVFLVVGSSLLVYPAAQLPQIAAEAGARLVIVNREATPLDALAEASIRTPIAETFEGVVVVE